MRSRLCNILLHNQPFYHPVVDYRSDTDKLLALDFTNNNRALTDEVVMHTKHLSDYINKTLEGYKYGIGGYNEDRILYRRSEHFSGEEPRSIHLGIDIWGPAGTAVFAPLGGVVHSFAFNNNFGDYGATIILQHQLDGFCFYTLYGHVSLKDLAGLQQRKFIPRGELLAHFGEPQENGDWPPHLHFQVIEDMNLKEGDYPGVCSKKDSEKYLYNCPDPNLILNMY